MRRRLAPLLALAAALAGLLAPGPARAAEGTPQPEIRAIVVTGVRMVEEATVRARISSREGAPYDPEQVSKDVRALWEMDAFEDVTVDAEGFEGGVRLTFRLVERPILRSVEFSGNREIKTDDLREKAALVLNGPYRAVAAQEAVGRIQALYREKGYYQAAVRTSVEPAGEGRVTLRLAVEEGVKYRLLTISFRGNKAFPEDRLRKEMQTAQWHVFSFLGSSGRLRQDVIQEDRQRLASLYQDEGYLEVRVGEPEIAVDDAEHTLAVVMPITEGRQYRLGKLALQGDDLVPLEEIRRLVGIGEGELFRRSAFAGGVSAIGQRYASRGYAFVKVDYGTRLDPERGTIDVTFLVERGPEARFGRVTIGGNVATRDKVIRRQLAFSEGDIFSSDALRKSRQRIMNLGFFDQVDIVPRPREESVIDVDVEVKERLTGAVTFGAGYSSEDKLTGQVRLSENNLFGRGQTLALMVEYSTVRQNYSVSFTEPAVLDSRWLFGFSVYNYLREYDEYDRKSVGGTVTLGRSLGEYFRTSVRLKRETVTVSDIKEGASQYILDQEGTASTNSVRTSLSRDSVDNMMNPTTGNRSSLTLEYAGGVFGGDNYFTKLEAEHTTYVPLFWKVVGMVHGQYGTVSGFDGREPPIYEKFFLGGIFSLRGFPFRSVGPLDDQGEPKGGYQELFFNAELILPIAPEQGFNLVVFYDTGNAWDKGEAVSLGDLRESAGFGIRWMSPMGPFRLEWGWILDRKDGEPNGDWSFVIGNFF